MPSVQSTHLCLHTSAHWVHMPLPSLLILNRKDRKGFVLKITRPLIQSFNGMLLCKCFSVQCWNNQTVWYKAVNEHQNVFISFIIQVQNKNQKTNGTEIWNLKTYVWHVESFWKWGGQTHPQKLDKQKKKKRKRWGGGFHSISIQFFVCKCKKNLCCPKK